MMKDNPIQNGDQFACGLCCLPKLRTYTAQKPFFNTIVISIISLFSLSFCQCLKTEISHTCSSVLLPNLTSGNRIKL